jgi:hypothetical protein
MGLDFGRSGFNLNRRSANADLGISEHQRKWLVG